MVVVVVGGVDARRRRVVLEAKFSTASRRYYARNSIESLRMQRQNKAGRPDVQRSPELVGRWRDGGGSKSWEDVVLLEG